MTQLRALRSLLLGGVFLGLLSVGVSGCASAGAKSEKSTSGSRATTDCKTCKRMCEVGGDAKDKSASVDKCKEDCAKKCK